MSCGLPYFLAESKMCNLGPHSDDEETRLCIACLPRDIIFNIFLRLPAEILANVVRRVCREWNNIIHSPAFVDAHILKSDKGCLIWSGGGKLSAPYVEIMEDDLKVANIHLSKFRGFILGSCNGLVWIIADQMSKHYIANPLTREIVSIPSPSLTARFTTPLLSSLGCTTTSKRFKLVEFYGGLMRLECGIMTLGVDKGWRCIGTINEILQIVKFPIDMHLNSPVTADGFLHWPHCSFNLTLDLESETFFGRAVPKCYKREDRTYLATGKSLSFMEFKGTSSWEFWLLTDVQNGDWTKQAAIDLEHGQKWPQQSLSPEGFKLEPIGWLKDGEIAIFGFEYENPFENQTASKAKAQPLRNCITYDVKTREVNSFQLGEDDEFYGSRICIPHVKSLVSLKFAAS